MSLKHLVISLLVAAVSSRGIAPIYSTCERLNDDQIPVHLAQLPEKCLKLPGFFPCFLTKEGFRFNPREERCVTIRVSYCSGCTLFSSLEECQMLCE
ncbi:hypothetical protein DSO57_1024291 [Entomophthora muscae]|uniref:Uncharacterized protein n=1 Tax=Entomophthora muscae TaxID=34485 RepID=A0ACC2TQ50_9FUNG|nr:hypothetical protein DSO57_1024291 [Entomophthora muscae]